MPDRCAGRGLRYGALRLLLPGLVLTALLATLMEVGAGARGAAGSLDLIEQSVDVGLGESWSARVRAAGTSGTATVVATVHEAVPNRLGYLNATGGGGLGGPIARIEPVAVDGSGGVVRVVLTDEARELARMEAPAVHPLVVTLRDEDGQILDDLTTFVVLVDEDTNEGRETAPLQAALVLPFGLEPRIAPDGTSQLTRRDEQQLGVIVEALSSHPGTPLTVDATAETLVALLDTGRSSSEELLADFADATTGRELLSRPFVTIQPAGWFENGMAGDVVNQIEASIGVFDLLLDGEATPDIWLGDPTLDAPAIEQLVGMGFNSLALPAVAAGTEPFRVAEVDGEHQAISVDADLGGHIGSTGDPVLDAHRVLADLAVISQGSAGSPPGALIIPPEDWAPNDPFLNTLIEGLEASATSRPATVAEVFAGLPDTQRTMTLETPPPDPLFTYPERLAEVSAEVSGLASVLPEAGDLVNELNTVLFTSGSEALGFAEREVYLSTVSATVDVVTPTVLAPEGRRVTMTGRTGVIPVALDNRTGRPVLVVVQLRSDKLEFPDGAAFEAQLEEGVNELEIGVKALTSGDSTLEVEVLSPDRSLELSSTTVTVRSTALSGVGLIIAAAALLILLAWWIRNFRSGRRDQRLVSAEHAAPETTGGSTSGAADMTD